MCCLLISHDILQKWILERLGQERRKCSKETISNSRGSKTESTINGISEERADSENVDTVDVYVTRGDE